MHWQSLLNEFDNEVLDRLNIYRLPQDHNPIVSALETMDVVGLCNDVPWFGKARIARLASICQMVVYDHNGGPDGDGKRKGLRRQWYSWFKTRFAQPFSQQLARHGDEKELTGFDGTGWAGRLSQVYSSLVDDEGATYQDLWVDDASRMMDRNWTALFNGCHIIVAVEKDSLFADFKAASKALGALSLVSGKGKQSKAATEKLLREHFGWRPEHDPFSEDKPLIVLHITDHDMDGERVIGPTFGEQARRYTSHILEARVGIKPEQVEDWQSDWYEVKTTNNGYINWAESQGLYLAECPSCEHRWSVQGVGPHECPQCWTETALVIKEGRQVLNQPYGFEVEALPTRTYYRLLVDALLQVLPFDYIVERLRDECTASAREAAERIKQGVLEDNESYQALLKEFDRLEAIKAEFESSVQDTLQQAGQPHIHNWWHIEPDPEPEDYEQYVEQARDYSEPWRPFSRDLRTQKLVQHLRTANATDIAEFTDEVIEW